MATNAAEQFKTVSTMYTLPVGDLLSDGASISGFWIVNNATGALLQEDITVSNGKGVGENFHYTYGLAGTPDSVSLVTSTEATTINTNNISYAYHLTTTGMNGSGYDKLSLDWTTAITTKGVETAALNLSAAQSFDRYSTNINSNGSKASFAALDVIQPKDSTVVCFAKGSLIAAMDGELPTELAVEKLKVGDKVLTISGHYEKIVWVGHRRVNCNKHSYPTQAWPVKVSKDAFGAGMPTQDLYLSPAHSVYVYGHLVPIQHLVNGITITQEERATVTYYHIELAQHSVVYAQGLPSETFLDSLNRQFFIEGNDAKIATLDLNEVEFAESARDHYLEHCYAPFVTEGPVLEAIFAKLLEKAGQSALMMAAQ